MEKLYRGIHKFQESYFKKEEEFFRRLSGKQDPEVLFITCADSRVDPTLPRFRTASFALFQHTGMSTEWSNLHLSALDY